MHSFTQVPSILICIMDAQANEHRFCTNPDVVLYVGQPATAFHVEMEAICEVSPVLNAAFTGDFRESHEKKMNLPEENIVNFGRFLQWTYTDKYHLSAFEADGTAENRIMDLAKLYVLADQYDVAKLKHDIIDRMYEIGQCSDPNSGPPHSVIRYVYDNSTRLSGFRKLLVAWYLKTRRMDFIFSDRGRLLEAEIPELQAEVALEASVRGPEFPFLRDRRVFYEPNRMTARSTNQ